MGYAALGSPLACAQCGPPHSKREAKQHRTETGGLAGRTDSERAPWPLPSLGVSRLAQSPSPGFPSFVTPAPSPCLSLTSRLRTRASNEDHLSGADRCHVNELASRLRRFSFTCTSELRIGGRQAHKHRGLWTWYLTSWNMLASMDTYPRYL